jgi:HAD superfamily hydrolase (TIGR01484 family)
MSTFRMLVVDLDGTALTHHNQLCDADRRAAAALRSRGVPVTIATGRLYTGTRWVAEALGTTGTVAVMNGSERVHVGSDTSVHADVLTAQERDRVREALVGTELSAFLFRSRRIHHNRSDARHAGYLGVWTPELEAHHDLLGHEVWTGADDVLAVGVMGAADRIRAVHDAVIDLDAGFGGVMFDTFSGERFLKLRRHTHDKASALHALAAERGLGVEDVVAIGDWINDVTMLREAGRSYAMGGSIAEVRAAADEELDAPRGQGGALAEVARRVWGVPRSELDG